MFRLAIFILFCFTGVLTLPDNADARRGRRNGRTKVVVRRNGAVKVKVRRGRRVRRARRTKVIIRRGVAVFAAPSTGDLFLVD